MQALCRKSADSPAEAEHPDRSASRGPDHDAKWRCTPDRTMKPGRAGYTEYRPRRTGTTRRRTRKGFRHHPLAIGGFFQSFGPDHVARSLALLGKQVKVSSTANANHFQIFGEDRGATSPRSIVRSPQRVELPA